MSVVLRCRTCGTSQARRGECEACSEGEVQYFCSNHEPRVWLEGPVCGRCGARFGEAPGTPSSAAGRRRTLPADAPDFRPPARRPPASDTPAPAPSLGELLEEITGASRHTRPPYEPEEPPWTGPSVRRVGFPLAGCLFRLVGLVGLLIVVAIIFLLFLFGGFIVD